MWQSLYFYPSKRLTNITKYPRVNFLLLKDLKKRFPGCMVVHLDPNEIQGIPDLLVLYRDRWAALEGKKTGKASHRPNQDYYVAKMNEMSYASFIYPENKEEILDELERSFTTARPARFSGGE